MAQAKHFDGFDAIARTWTREAIALKDMAEGMQERFLVVHQQDDAFRARGRGHRHRHAGAVRFRRRLGETGK